MELYSFLQLPSLIHLAPVDSTMETHALTGGIVVSTVDMVVVSDPFAGPIGSVCVEFVALSMVGDGVVAIVASGMKQK